MRSQRLLRSVCCIAVLQIRRRHWKAVLIATKGMAGKSTKAAQMAASSATLEMPSLCFSRFAEAVLNDTASEASPKRQRGDSTSQGDRHSHKKTKGVESEQSDMLRKLSDTKDSQEADVTSPPDEYQSSTGPSTSSASKDQNQDRKYKPRSKLGAAKNSTWKCLRDRQWEIIRGDSAYMRHIRSRQHFSFKVASYNILAQNLLEEHMHLYEGTPEKFLDWNYRKANLMSEIDAYNPEILCLQEVDKWHSQEFFEPELAKRGYSGVHKARTGDKTDGCAIFFKTAKFKHEESVPVSFFRPGINVLDRDNVGLLVKLRPISSRWKVKTSIVVATTHLLFNPRRGDIKLAQLMLLLAEIDKLSFDPRWKNGKAAQHCPVILCGDFNAAHASPLYRLLEQGRLSLLDLGQRWVSGQLFDTYGGQPVSIPVLPQALGIADTCQYQDELYKRLSGNVGNSVVSSPAQVNQSRSNCPPQWQETNPSSYSVPAQPAAQSSGTTYFSLSSATVVDVKNSSSDAVVLQSTSAFAVVAHEENLLNPPGNSAEKMDISESGKEDMHSKIIFGGPEIFHPFKFKSVYEQDTCSREDKRLVTSCHKRDVCNVDYIFYHSLPRPGKENSPLRLSKRLKLLTAGDQRRHRIFLPNKYVSSDHVMLLAQFTLNLK